MKAISLLQPWASLAVMGIKRYETRIWNTDHRGPLLIHASQRWDRKLLKIAQSTPFRHFIDHPDALPRGRIIGQVEVVRTLKTAQWLRDFPGYADSDEFYFGDYDPGRWAWELRNAVQFAEPIPTKGALSLWRPTPDVLALVQEQVMMSQTSLLTKSPF